MYSSKSDKLDKSGGVGDGLPGGGNQTDEHFAKSQILDFVDGVETLNVVVERPVAGWQPSANNDEESFTLPSEGTKGLALIINIVEFDNDITNINRRYGSEHDVEYLTHLLIQLDYKLYPSAPSIRERKNKSERVIKLQIESFKNACTEQRPASIIVFIGSHGRHPNEFVTSDRKWLNIYKDVVYRFTQDPNFTVLEGKPKIFLVQACQSYSSTSGEPMSTHESVHQEQQQLPEDVYICTATTPGKVSRRNICKGSWFPYCFTYMMMKHALKMESLQQIMNLVKNRMDEIKDDQEYKQVPSYITGTNSKPLYFVGSDYSSRRVRNYDNLRWMEGASKFCIICTIDKHITCDKLADHFREYSVVLHEWNQFPEFLQSDRCHLEDKVVDVVTDCTTKHFELCLRKLEKIQRHRIIFITTIEKESMMKLNPAEYKVDVRVDPMFFEDLSLAYQFKIVERLENKFGVSLSEDELHWELVFDIITGREMFHDEIKPRQRSYYVPRMVLTRNIISDKLFEERNLQDIFIIKGIQWDHLSFLVKNQMTGRSQDQIENITVNFITLDDDSHFDIICGKPNQTKPVHLLNYENGRLRWIRTKGNIKTIHDHVSEKQDEQFEEQFCSLICAHSSAPVCISDSPGMGKTILLAQIGKGLRRMFPDRTVLFIELSSFIQRVANATKSAGGIENQIIVTALQDTVCKTLLGRHILESKLKSSGVSIELLLDGFDEVEHNDSDFAHVILKKIRGSFNSIRNWVTSRPHKLMELEETLGGLGYNIKPFQLVDQVNFMTQFWSQNTKLDSKRLTDFARNCLKSLKSKINSSQPDIAGIPLQCLLIGEVYERRAVAHAKIGATSPLPEQFAISSITTLYEEVVKRKLEKYASTYWVLGNPNESDSSRGLIINWLRSLGVWVLGAPSTARQILCTEKLNELHAHLGLHLIFPNLFKKLKLSFREQEICEVLNLGVWELSGGTEPRVLHRTFAEYFVALFIRDRLLSGNGWGKVLAEFFMQNLLQVKVNKNDVPEFVYPVVVYFLNSLLTPDMNTTDGIVILPKVAKDIKNHISDEPQLSQLVHALAYANCDNILKFLDKIGAFRKPDTACFTFDEKFMLVAISHSGVELIRLGFHHFDQHHHEKFDSVMKSKFLRWAVARGQDGSVEYLINEKGLRTMIEELQDGTKTLLHHCLAVTMDNTEAEIDQRIEILRMLNEINEALKEERDEHGDPPLLVRHSHVRLRLELIRLGVDVTAQGNNDETILHGGRGLDREDYQTIVKRIKEMGRLNELVHFQCKKGMTPLLSIIMVFDPHPETIKMFGEAGADMNYARRTEWLDGILTKGPALVYAVSCNRSVYTLKTLIELKADINCRSMNGNSLLHIAADAGTKSAAALEFLVSVHGMDVNVTNDDQKTPLDLVLERRHCNIDTRIFEMGLLIFELGGRPNNYKCSISPCKGSRRDTFEYDWNNMQGHSRGWMGGGEYVDDRTMMYEVSRGGWVADDDEFQRVVRRSSWEGNLFQEGWEMKSLYVDLLLLHIYLFGNEMVESGKSGMTTTSSHPLNYSYLKALLLKKGAEDRSYGAMGRLAELLQSTVERTTPIWDQDTIDTFRAGELI